MKITKHAHSRVQQRGIKSEIIPLIIKYGNSTDRRDGAIGYLIDRKCQAQLLTELAMLRERIERASMIEVRTVGEDIVTCFHKTGSTKHSNKGR